MKRVIALTLPALAAATVLACAASLPPPTPSASALQPFEPVSGGANYALVEVGAQAPDFSFDAQGRSLRLRDLRAQGHVLLVFAPDEARLVALERERARLLSLGVTPVALLDERAGACTATVRRLGLDYLVIPDPRRVIGAQFNSLDPLSRAVAPAWFVLGRSGKVYGLARGEWPEGSWSAVAAHALGLTDPDVAPASSPRD